MSATRWQREGTKLNRDDHDARARALGHDVVWKLGPNATRKGHCYFFEGVCKHCHGTINVASSWTSCSNHVDLRSDKPCGGPGTHILTDIETARVSELLAPAFAEFAGHVRRAIAAQN